MSAVSDSQLHNGSVSEGSLVSGSDRDEDHSEDHQGVGNCGVGPCRLRWLQVFAKPIWFMLFLNIYCFVEGAIVSGKILCFLVPNTS